MTMAEEPVSGKITSQQRRKSMLCAKIYSLSQVVGFSCVGTSTLSLVAIKLGAGEVFLGLLNMVMISTLVFCVFTMSTVEKRGKKYVILLWQGIAVACCLPFLIVPLTAGRWPSEISLAVLLVAAFTRVATVALGSTGWFPFLQDIVPPRITGRFFASLRTAWQSVNLVSLLAIGWFLGKDSPWWKFEVVFAVAILAYTVRVLSILPTTEKPPKGTDADVLKLSERFAEIFRDKSLLNLSLFVTTYWVASTVATPFKLKYLKDLDYGDGYVLAATAMISAGAVVSLKIWGRLSDRFGNRAILTLCHIGLPLVTAAWVFVKPGNYVFVFGLFLGWSIFNSGAGIAMIRLLMHRISAEKQNQINVINVISNFFMGLAPLAAGLFLRSLEGVELGLGGPGGGNYHVFFLVSSALFVVPYIASKRLHSSQDKTTREMVMIMTRPLLSMMGPVVGINAKRSLEKQSKRS